MTRPSREVQAPVPLLRDVDVRISNSGNLECGRCIRIAISGDEVAQWLAAEILGIVATEDDVGGSELIDLAFDVDIEVIDR